MIGIDFDNTIACYDQAFYIAALEKGIIPPNIEKSKNSIRDYLRKKDESLWTELQGYIYGYRMDLAYPFVGVEHFLKNFKDICIISHKTKYPYLGPKYNLHLSAMKWIKKHNFPTPYFEHTLEDKLKRIADLCDFFIDDLPELLLETSFPKKVKKILFDPKNQHEDNAGYLRVSSWEEIIQFFKNHE